jgi:hypothetical protein
MIVEITLTNYGSDVGPFFDLYSNLDGYTTAFESGVPKADLIAGYITTVPDGATTIRIQSTGVCESYLNVTIQPMVTTTTTTTLQPYWYVLYRCDDAQTYYVGPFTVVPDEFSTGERVEGATDIFYTITSTTNVEPESTITGITSTGEMGCP